MKEFYVVCTKCRKEIRVDPPIGLFFLTVCDNPDCQAEVGYDKHDVREREVAGSKISFWEFYRATAG